MRNLLARWRRLRPTPAGHLRPDHRPELAAAMCSSCARRWLCGRRIWHPWCGVRLRDAFDLYFERLHDGS